MPRTVTLLVVDDDGAPLGSLPPFEVAVAWWPEVGDVVREAYERYGADLVVLRLLRADRPAQPGGAVTYVAQLHGPTPDGLPLTDEVTTLPDDPLRADYARPGGPRATLQWAREALAVLGRGPLRQVQQSKTWNLSSLWRLTTDAGLVWIKEVPFFFAQEPAVITWLMEHGHRERVPNLLASDGRRMLLDHIPGADLFGAPLSVRLTIAEEAHAIQRTTLSAVDELLAAGAPDARRPTLLRDITAAAEPAVANDPRLGALIDGLDDRLRAVEACGLPDVLVHGDLHPGNVRADGDGPHTIIDWGDSCIGHPAFDVLRLTDGLEADEAKPVLSAWAGRWRAEVAGCDPERAVELLRPVEALRGAAVYASFLRNIEATEHPYHAQDVPDCLARAVDLAG